VDIAVEMFFYLLFPFVFLWVKTNVRCLVGFVLIYVLFNIFFTEIYKFVDLYGFLA